jgi:hypothetical protein
MFKYIRNMSDIKKEIMSTDEKIQDKKMKAQVYYKLHKQSFINRNMVKKTCECCTLCYGKNIFYNTNHTKYHLTTSLKHKFAIISNKLKLLGD